MIKPRLAALLGAAALAATGFCHAAAVPLKAAPPASAPAVYAPAAGLEVSPSEGELPIMADIAATPAAHAAPGKDDPFYTSLLDAGRFVLDVGSFSQQRAQPRAVSAAPLPGALWLFGSALLAFLAIAGRRKF